MILTNLVLSAFILIESGGNWSAVGDRGTALGGLQIRPAMVQDFNRATGAGIRHHDVKDPATAFRVARWYFDHVQARHKRALTVRELYQTWNAGPDAVRKGQGMIRARKAAALYNTLKAGRYARKKNIFFVAKASRIM